MTEAIKASEVRQHFSSVINRVATEDARVVVEKSGVPVAAIVPITDLRRLKQIDADIAERKRVVEAMRAPFRGVPPEEIERETERIMAELREEDRQRRQRQSEPVSAAQ